MHEPRDFAYIFGIRARPTTRGLCTGTNLGAISAVAKRVRVIARVRLCRLVPAQTGYPGSLSPFK